MKKAGSLILLILTFGILPVAASAATLFDFDGDGRADISVFRPSDGFWYVMNSSGGFSATQFGRQGDQITPGDYDGDAKTDVAVYRGGKPGVVSNFVDNFYHILKSSDNTHQSRLMGQNALVFHVDLPFPADYDGDGKTDLTIARHFDGVPGPLDFQTLQSSTGSSSTKRWGYNIDKKVIADYDGDGRADLAVFRQYSPSNSAEVNTWFILQSSNGAVRIERFGLATDKFVPADYDGDGRADIAVYRPSNGFWYVLQSRDGFRAEQFGAAADKPVPADYDGDGRADIAVFRPENGTWYLNKSKEGFAAYAFGLSSDLPVPSAYVR